MRLSTPSQCRKGKKVWVVLSGTVLLLLITFISLRIGANGGETTGGGSKQPAVVSAQETITDTLFLPLVMRNYPRLPPIFGVHMGRINNVNGLAQAVEANAYWVNFGAFSWWAIEPERTDPPTYNWAAVDEQSLINASQEGLTVVARVHWTPPWAREIPNHNCSRIKEEYFDEFAQFLTALVNRYKLSPYNVEYWELDSEVDVDPSIVPDPANPIGFWCWGDASDEYYGGGYFAEMLKAAHPAIKAADPRAKVVIGGLLLDCDPRNPPPDKDCKSSRFLEGILRGAGGPYFDVVSFHAYAYNLGTEGQMGNPNWTEGEWRQATAVLEKASFIHEVLGTYGYEDKGLMNMEAALMCFEASEACFQTQAMYVPRAYAEALALNLTAQVWFTMKEPVWRYTGLLHADLTPKPAYDAYKTATSFLTDVEYLEPKEDCPGVEGYTLRRLDRSAYIDVIWSADGSPVGVGLPSGASAYDKYGGLIASSGTIQVDYSPVYIRRP